MIWLVRGYYTLTSIYIVHRYDMANRCGVCSAKCRNLAHCVSHCEIQHPAENVTTNHAVWDGMKNTYVNEKLNFDISPVDIPDILVNVHINNKQWIIRYNPCRDETNSLYTKNQKLSATPLESATSKRLFH